MSRCPGVPTQCSLLPWLFSDITRLSGVITAHCCVITMTHFTSRVTHWALQYTVCHHGIFVSPQDPIVPSQCAIFCHFQYHIVSQQHTILLLCCPLLCPVVPGTLFYHHSVLFCHHISLLHTFVQLSSSLFFHHNVLRCHLSTILYHNSSPLCCWRALFCHHSFLLWDNTALLCLVFQYTINCGITVPYGTITEPCCVVIPPYRITVHPGATKELYFIIPVCYCIIMYISGVAVSSVKTQCQFVPTLYTLFNPSVLLCH